MSYKNLLVHVDNSEACAARIEVAIALAESHEAHLSAVSPVGIPSMPTYMAGALPLELMDAQEKHAQERAEAAAARFRAMAERSGISHEARVVRCLDIDAVQEINLQARYADLVILGQVDPKDPPSGGRSMVEDVVLVSGRPALIVPYIGAPSTLGERIMVAWDSGREAARALQDALPLLERASQVTVIVVDPDSGPTTHGEEPGADIAHHLARHGVSAQVYRAVSADISVGDTILARLSDEGSDLLVMGAYGHTRFREMILGGVTRSILEQMTVPVLMSH